MSLAALIERLTGPGHRTVAFTRRALIAGGAAFAALSVWAVATVCYFLFQDDIAAGLMARQSAMQQAYEERIGALRVHLDRLASQNLLDQNGLDKRVADLAARQGLIETRQAFLARLSDPSSAGAGMPAAPPIAPPALSAAGVHGPEAAKPMPIPDSFDLRLRREAEPPRGAGQRASEPTTRSLRDRLASVERSLAMIEAKQLQNLDALLRTAEARASGLRDAVREAGLDPDALETSVQGGIGGPLVPMTGVKAGLFETMIDQVQASVGRVEQLGRAVSALPFGRPMPGDVDLTSGFGYRVDPFTRGPAMHTGLDFRAEYGAPVRASGAGQVVGAEYAGGYGNMVEIDHGNGVTTRYAHLSSIAVAVGQTVETGAVLGRAGSTGRSTGAHLHYETRIDGEAVDPQRFLRAGLRLGLAAQAAR
jgi:murein DD-endopeptidase MepM/ murein hydrolase activator NlpD